MTRKLVQIVPLSKRAARQPRSPNAGLKARLSTSEDASQGAGLQRLDRRIRRDMIGFGVIGPCKVKVTRFAPPAMRNSIASSDL